MCVCGEKHEKYESKQNENDQRTAKTREELEPMFDHKLPAKVLTFNGNGKK